MTKQPGTVTEQPGLRTNTTFRFPLKRIPTEASAIFIPAKTLGFELFLAMNRPTDLAAVFKHAPEYKLYGDKLQERLTLALKSGELPLLDDVLRFPTPYQENLDGLSVSSSDLKAWVAKIGWAIEYYCPALDFLDALPATNSRETTKQQPQGTTWQESAREIADEFFDHDTSCNCRDSLKNYARRVMDEMQKRGIHGPRGRFDNPGTIQREALAGDKWWANKAK